MVNIVPGLVGQNRLRDLARVEHVQAVPEEKVCHAQEENQARRLRPGWTPAEGQPPEPCKARDAYQHEEAGDRRDVVNLECRKEICAQREQRQRHGHPGEAVLAQGRQKGRERQVERREEEETVVAYAIFQALQVGA